MIPSHRIREGATLKPVSRRLSSIRVYFFLTLVVGLAAVIWWPAAAAAQEASMEQGVVEQEGMEQGSMEQGSMGHTGMDMDKGMGMRGGWALSLGHLARSTAHWIGILGGVAIVFFSISVWGKMQGSLAAGSSLLVAIGTALFVLVFVDMEVGHFIGAGFLSTNVSISTTQLWWMAALAAMITLYTFSYWELVVGVGGGLGNNTLRRLPPGRLAAGTIAVFVLLAVLGSIDWQLPGGSTVLHGAQSAAHVAGFGFSLLLAYYANRARQQFQGGIYAKAATYTLMGAVLFAIAFAVRELGHDFGVDVFPSAGGMQLKMAMSMVLFTGTVFAFGWAYYRLVKALSQ